MASKGGDVLKLVGLGEAGISPRFPMHRAQYWGERARAFPMTTGVTDDEPEMLW